MFKLIQAGLAASIFLSISAAAQTTAFTYQGKLMTGSNSANGLYDISFTAYNSLTSGQVVSGPVTNKGIAVSNGLFIAQVDFGSNAFAGGSTWLQLAVSTNDANAFITLSPRQPVTPVPYAMYAESSGVAASFSNASGSAVLLNSNGVVISPSNFFTANSNLLGSIVSATLASSVTNLPVASQSNTGLLSPNDYLSIRYNPGSYYNGPPMSINSWPDNSNNQGTEYGAGFDCGFVQKVNQLCTNALRNFGWDTAVIDGGWYGYRDPVTGQLHENASVWPDGLSNCVRWAHSLGIKVGIWHSLGLTTSVGMGVQQGFAYQAFYNGTNYWAGNTNATNQLFPPGFTEDQLVVLDATWFAQMGIDYVKLEMGTNSLFTDAQEAAATQLFYQTMVSNGKRPYIMSAVGTDRNQPWMTGLINAERSGQYDMPNASAGGACWSQFLNNFFWAAAHPEQSGPGNYISTDIIPDYYSNTNQSAAMLILAAMLSSELSIGGSVVPPPAAYNQNIIAIDQDPAALMARPVYTNSDPSNFKQTVYCAYDPGGTNTTLYLYYGPVGSDYDNVEIATNYYASNYSDTNVSIVATVLTNLTASTLYDYHFWPSNQVSGVIQDFSDGSFRTEGLTVWLKNLTSAASGSFAVAFLNTGPTNVTFTVTNVMTTLGATSQNMYCQDLTSNTIIVVNTNWAVTVPGQMAYGFKLWPQHTNY